MTEDVIAVFVPIVMTVVIGLILVTFFLFPFKGKADAYR